MRDFINEDPDPDLLDTADESHERGAILVAAVFDAFLSIYRGRTADLFRLTGVMPGSGAPLHPDLTSRLAREAGKSADHVLRMCIRALDYMPPVDVQFGEFLRAIITADTDLIPDDRLNYRVAFIEAFRKRGIFASDCLSMSPDSLLWERPLPDEIDSTDILREELDLTPKFNRDAITAAAESNRRKLWYWLIQPELSIDGNRRSAATRTFNVFLSKARTILSAPKSPDNTGARGRAVRDAFIDESASTLALAGLSTADLDTLKAELTASKNHFARWETFFKALTASPASRVRSNTEVDDRWASALGLLFRLDDADPLHTIHGSSDGLHVEVHSVRLSRRAGPDGQDVRQLVVEVTQRRKGFYDPDTQALKDKAATTRDEPGEFVFRGGATMIIDLQDGTVRYVIRKAIDDETRLQRQRAFLGSGSSTSFTYVGGRTHEPFALLHRH